MMADSDRRRTQRLQVMLDSEELRAIDVWRFRNAMPTRAAAIRELVRRGLSTTDDPHALAEAAPPTITGKSTDYGVIGIVEHEEPPPGSDDPDT